MKITRARLETRHFTFEAFGESEPHAIAALQSGLNRHAEQYRLPAGWWHIMREDVFCTEIELGACYRDNEQMKGKNHDQN